MTTRKGCGVIAMRDFKVNDFLLEYAGELVDREQGKARHEEYKKNHMIGSYIFDFQYREKHYRYQY